MNSSSVVSQIGQRLTLVSDCNDRIDDFVRLIRADSQTTVPDRHLHDLRRRAAAVHLLPLPVPAVFRLDDRLVKKAGEIIDVNVGAQNDVAAPAAIAAIRTALRDKFLAAKTDAAAPAISGLRKHFDSIDKHERGTRGLQRWGSPGTVPSSCHACHAGGVRSSGRGASARGPACFITALTAG